jgi:hypothetical protein
MSPTESRAAGANEILLQEGLSALQGMEHALSRRGREASQIGLHVHDLGSTFRVLGYSLEAKSIEELAHQFDPNNPIMVALVREVVGLYRELFSAIHANDSDQILAVQGRLRTTTSEIDTYSSVAQSQVSGFASVDWAEDFSKPMAGLPVQSLPSAPAQTATPDALPVHADRQLADLRARGLELLQRARQENSSGKARSVTHVDWLLSELQDWFSHLGAVYLRDIFSGSRHLLGEISVDTEVAQALKGFTPHFRGSVSVEAKAFSLSVTLSFKGLSSPGIEYDSVARAIGLLGGKVWAAEAGLCVRVPVSLQRMRMVPVRYQGEHCVISHSQLLGDLIKADQPVDLQIAVGNKTVLMRCDSVGDPQNMNVVRSERELRIASGAVGTAVDAQGERYPWIIPS